MNARRDVRLVAAAKSVSWLGDEVALVALTLRLQSEGRGAPAVAALLVANLLPILLLSGVVGRWVDRYDNRALLVASSLAQAAVCTVLAFGPAPGLVLALMAALGAGQAVNSATWSALLPAIVERDDLPRALGLVQAGTTTAGIVAPALGGLLTGLYGARVPLLVDAASFVLVLAVALRIRTRRAVAAPAKGDPRPHGGFRIVRSDGLLRPLFLLLALFVLIGSMVNVVEVFLVRETLHASTTWYGIAGAAFSVGALSGALSGGRLSGPPRLARGFVAAAVLLALGLVGIGLSPSVYWLLPIGFLAGVGNGVLNVALGSLVMGRVGAGERGRVGALLSGVASGTQLLAYGAAALLAGVLDPRAIFVLAGGLGLAAPLLLGRGVVRAAAADDRADSADMTTPDTTPTAPVAA